MKRSFMNYVQEANSKIGGYPGTPVVETLKKKPKISVAPRATEPARVQVIEITIQDNKNGNYST